MPKQPIERKVYKCLIAGAILLLTYGHLADHGHAASAIAHVQGTNASAVDIFKGMKYRNIGPNRGGRSLGAAGSPSRKNEYYFGAVGGGCWKTTDGGLNWLPVTDGQLGCSSVGAGADSETNPDIMYIGTRRAEFRGDIMQRHCGYKSIHAGK